MARLGVLASTRPARHPAEVTRPIVHVGYHKTATTWFQKSVYPSVRNFAYVPRERVNRAFLDASAFHFDPAACRDRLALPAGVPPILCEEALSGTLLGGGFMGFQSAAAAERIRDVLPDARIVLFVRSQPEMISAAYLQYLRNGGTHGSHRFLFPDDYGRARAPLPRREARFSFDHFEYEGLIAHYAELFGREQIHVYAYEELRKDPREFLRRLAGELELQIDVAAVPMEKRNPSYSLAVSQLARFLNRFTAHSMLEKRHWVHVPGWYEIRKRLLEALSASRALGPRASAERLLGAETVAWIRSRYWQSNRRLAAWVKADLRALGYALDEPKQEPPRPRGGLARWWLSH
jgi:hypothetical protein